MPTMAPWTRPMQGVKRGCGFTLSWYPPPSRWTDKHLYVVGKYLAPDLADLSDILGTDNAEPKFCSHSFFQNTIEIFSGLMMGLWYLFSIPMVRGKSKQLYWYLEFQLDKYIYIYKGNGKQTFKQKIINYFMLNRYQCWTAVSFGHS